ALGQLGLVASSFHLLATKAVGLFGARLKLFLNGERHFQRQRRHGFYKQVADGAIEAGAKHALAGWFSLRDASLLAHVLGLQLPTQRVVADGHALAAAATDSQSLK